MNRSLPLLSARTSLKKGVAQRVGWLKHLNREEVVTILEVAGTPDAAPAIQRHRGFLEILSKPEHRGRLRIVQSVVADFNYDEAERVTTTFLKNSDPKQINAVFAQSDAMAFGAIKA